MSSDERIEGLLRSLAPQVLGVLVRRHGQFDACEDAVQEALLPAALQWPRDGVPENPRGWLITVASRRLADEVRSNVARRRREDETSARQLDIDLVVTAPDSEANESGNDDTLTLLFLCCHPSLSSASQLALTLRAVGGLTTTEIAHAFLVPEATMGQRISRAKQQIRSAGATFDMPPDAQRSERLAVVLQVLYLIFNEGYASTSGAHLQRADLTAEAVRLTRMLHELLPDDGEVAGLLALMLLTDARRAARTGPNGELIPLAEQDRELWNRASIDEGVALITHTLASRPLGAYQVQAAIAAVHDEAAADADTDWLQILMLYDVLARISPNPMVTLNRAVAVAMVEGPRAGLAALTALDDDERTRHHHRLEAVRAHLLEMAGDDEQAVTSYRLAARRAMSRPEQRYLDGRAATLSQRLR